MPADDSRLATKQDLNEGFRVSGQRVENSSVAQLGQHENLSGGSHPQGSIQLKAAFGQNLRQYTGAGP
jgi:hypothetical protein